MTFELEEAAGRLMVLAQQGDGDAYARLLTLLSGVARQYARSRLAYSDGPDLV